VFSRCQDIDCSFQSSHIEVTRKGGLLATRIGLHQSLCHLHDEAIDRQRLKGAPKDTADRGRQFLIHGHRRADKW